MAAVAAVVMREEARAAVMAVGSAAMREEARAAGILLVAATA